VQQEVFSLAPEDHSEEAPARKPAPFAAIGVMVAVVLVALFFVSERFDSGAHHYDTAAAQQTLPTAAPDITASPSIGATAQPAATPTTPTGDVPLSTKFTGLGFRASFPVTPVRGTQSSSFGPVTMSVTTYIADTAGASYAIGVIPLGSTDTVDLMGAYRGGAAGMGGTVQTANVTTFRGYPAVEGEMASPDGPVRALVLRAPERVLMIFVQSDTQLLNRYNAFRDSIELL
jgi:hypothetical protein